MDELISGENKVSKILNSQRKTGRFCDITLKLNNDFQVWAHFCVLAPQSNFVGDNYFLQKDMQFSIHNPLKIEIFNFDCEECLCDIMDFVYSDEMADQSIISGEHEDHIRHLCKILSLQGVSSRLAKKKGEVTIEEIAKENVKFEVRDKQQKKSAIFQYKIKTRPAQSKMIACHGCSFECFRPSEMLMHLNFCPSNNPKCCLCDHTFANSTEFKNHLLKHDNNKPYYCNDCDLRFGTKTGLKLHIPKHSTGALHMCSVCGKGFKWKHGLDNHLIVHSAEKKLLCDECGYSTSHLKALRTHQLSHTGFSFKCTAKSCSYTSRRKENLKLHIETHKNELPFVCEICGRRFSQNKNLKRHSLIHFSKNSLKCPHCSFANYRTDKLKQHISNHHTSPIQLELTEDVQCEPEQKDIFIVSNEKRIKQKLKGNKFTEMKTIESYSTLVNHTKKGFVPIKPKNDELLIFFDNINF